MKRRVIYDFCSGIQCQKYFNIHSSHKLVCVAIKYLRLQQENNRKPAVNQSYCATVFSAGAGHWHNYSSLRCPWTKSNKITAKTFFLRVISLCIVKPLKNPSPWKHFTVMFHANISYMCLRKPFSVLPYLFSNRFPSSRVVTFYVCMEMQNMEHDCHNSQILLKTRPPGHVAKIFL